LAQVRITMAAIDPTASPIKPDEPLRATLKIMRRAPDADDYDMSDDDEDEENDEDNDEEESEDEAPKGKNGKKLSKKEADAAVKKALKIAQENAEKMEVDAEEEDDEEDEELEDGDFEVEEFVLCTLDPKNVRRSQIDISVGLC
jgi:FK506-binding nuclear protein